MNRSKSTADKVLTESKRLAHEDDVTPEAEINARILMVLNDMLLNTKATKDMMTEEYHSHLSCQKNQK